MLMRMWFHNNMKISVPKFIIHGGITAFCYSNLDWNNTSHNCYPWYFGVTWPWRKGLSSSQFTHSQNVCPSWILVSWDDVVLLVGWLYWGFTSLQRYFSHIATWKQEITNLWKFKWRCRESNPGPLTLQAKSLTTRPPLLPDDVVLVEQKCDNL